MSEDKESGKRPVLRHNDGAVEVAIWEHETDKGPIYSTQRSRFYRGEDGKWKKTHSIPERDLLKAARLDQKAYESIARLRQQAQDGPDRSETRRRQRDDRER
ncbi:hypothetical protein [Shimia sp. MMG029]|uniref:hypothetical protein n=1 Tax=Shimia sp. MMG029 TaxID=3021978 RepID=UPI0022FE60A7|nr:hypothetical protein [Shimia sp. MMG029]MDA5556174.1 hypothetical protein [Shimia sp. MMG029]